MSRIYFHSEDGTAEVSGAERANMDIMTEHWARGAIGLTLGSPTLDRHLYEGFKPFINPEGRLANVPEQGFGEALGKTIVTRAFYDYAAPFIWKGKPIKLSSLIANTVLAVGSDPARLATKIHNTCEIYGYAQGFHRKWLADVIEEGVEEKIFRKGYWDFKDSEGSLKMLMGIEMTEEEQTPTCHSFGWDTVIDLLRSSSKGAVVMSFSVCDRFPNSSIGDWMPPWPEGVEEKWDALTEAQQEERSRRSDEWYDISDARQWAISMKGLKDPSFRYFNQPITPQNLRTWRFGHELSLLDLAAHDIELIERKLKIKE